MKKTYEEMLSSWQDMVKDRIHLWNEIEYIIDQLNYLKDFASDSYEWGDPQENGRNTLIPAIDAEDFKKLMDLAMEMIMKGSIKNDNVLGV